MARIFVSYAEEDRAVAGRIAHLLQALGWTVWWDRTIPAGKTWREAIDAALREADSTVVLWSRHSVRSAWVCEEAEEARNLGKLIPVLIEPVTPPLGFRSIHAADLTAWDGSDETSAFRRLVADLQPLVAKPSAALKEASQASAPTKATHEAVDPSHSLAHRGTPRRLRAVLIVGLTVVAAILAIALMLAQRPATILRKPAEAAVSPLPVVTAVANLPLEEALLVATSETLAEARLRASTSLDRTGRRALVVDFPGEGTRTAGSGWSAKIRAADLVRQQYPVAEAVPLTMANVAQKPLILIGHVYPSDELVGAAKKPTVYSVCAILIDLKSGKIAGRHTLQVLPLTPAPLLGTFQSTGPIGVVWPSTPSFADVRRMCTSGTAGNPIDQTYLGRIVATALTGEAADAYGAGRYEEALTSYRAALGASGVDQLRVLNGLYLAAERLGRREEAAVAFSRLVAYALTEGKLGMKLLFNPGSSAFITDARISARYAMWLQEIGAQVAQKLLCLEIVGHSDRKEAGERAGDALSIERAERVKRMIETDFPQIAWRITAKGRGYRENIIGTGTSDAADALDRRVEFHVVECK